MKSLLAHVWSCVPGAGIGRRRDSARTLLLALPALNPTVITLFHVKQPDRTVKAGVLVVAQ